LLFAMIVPENRSEDHLKLLAHVAELFSDPEMLKALRAAANPGELLQLLSHSQPYLRNGTRP
jgi:PTS system nitrogen regulatory IIA component